MKKYVIFILTVLMLSTFLYGSIYESIIKKTQKEIESKNQDIKKLKEEIKQKKDIKKQYEKEHKLIEGEIENIKSKLNIVKKSIKETNEQILEKDKRINEVKNNMLLMDERVRKNKELILLELDYIYRRHYAFKRIIPQIWVKNLRGYSVSSKYKDILLTTSKKNEYKMIKEKYENEKISLVQKDKNLRDEEEKYMKNIDEKKIKMSNIVQLKDMTEKEINKLNKTINEMETLIKQLEKKKKETQEMKLQEELAKKEFDKKKGYIPWPVSGNIVVNFGKTIHPELKYPVISNGIKIETTPGSPVLCVEKGEVVYAEDFRSYGKTVIVSHGGGAYTIYGMLSDIIIKEGMKVNLLQQIGTTSKSDGIVYFEIRINGNPEDPVLWLKK